MAIAPAVVRAALSLSGAGLGACACGLLLTPILTPYVRTVFYADAGWEGGYEAWGTTFVACLSVGWLVGAFVGYRVSCRIYDPPGAARRRGLADLN